MVAAYALQRYGVPFVILERATRSKICSNAGSGFELTPTSVEILRNRLGIEVNDFMSYYSDLGLMTMGGRIIRHAKLPEDYAGGSVNRSEMQKYLLDLLFPSPADEEGRLLCGSGVASYREDRECGVVTVTLESGREVEGCVLLACDGIRSRCRAVLHGGGGDKDNKDNKDKDPLHFCGAISYWGKTASPKGSDLRREFNAMIERPEPSAADDDDDDDDDFSRAFAVLGMSTRKCAASFFVIPTQNYTVLNWAVTVGSETEARTKANDGKDLTRRGGGALTESEKRRIFDFSPTKKNDDDDSVVRGAENFAFLRALIEATPAADITEAGLYDRENLDLPYTSESKLVALLGDSAHPQTPFMGQGVNMAIADAYVYATNIAVALRSKTKKKSLRRAVADSDAAFRRRDAKKVVVQARDFCRFSITRNPLLGGLLRLYARCASSRELVGQVVKTDKSNRRYLRHLDEKVLSVSEQEALRRM